MLKLFGNGIAQNHFTQTGGNNIMFDRQAVLFPVSIDAIEPSIDAVIKR